MANVWRDGRSRARIEIRLIDGGGSRFARLLGRVRWEFWRCSQGYARGRVQHDLWELRRTGRDSRGTSVCRRCSIRERSLCRRAFTAADLAYPSERTFPLLSLVHRRRFAKGTGEGRREEGRRTKGRKLLSTVDSHPPRSLDSL